MADKDATDSVKTVLYPYNTTQSKNIDGVKYNLLPDEQLNNCYTIIVSQIIVTLQTLKTLNI